MEREWQIAKPKSAGSKYFHFEDWLQNIRQGRILNIFWFFKKTNIPNIVHVTHTRTHKPPMRGCGKNVMKAEWLIMYMFGFNICCGGGIKLSFQTCLQVLNRKKAHLREKCGSFRTVGNLLQTFGSATATTSTNLEIHGKLNSLWGLFWPGLSNLKILVKTIFDALCHWVVNWIRKIGRK